MKRIKSKLTLVKKRIKASQRNAKWAGFFYLIGTIVLAAAALVFNLLNDTVVYRGKMPITNAIDVIPTFDFAELDMFAIVDLAIFAVYAIMVLVLVINVIRAVAKLGMLFKKRASYYNGFNRNMYAMDDMSKAFSCSLATIINANLIIFVASAFVGAEVAVSQMGIIVLAAGLVIRVLAGLMEGKATLFTVGDKIEEEAREFGLGIFFIRSILQIVVTAAVVYLLAPNSDFGGNGVFTALTTKPFDINAVLAAPGLIPFAIEALAWVLVMALVARTVSAKEFNREGMDAPGIKAYRVATFFVAIIVAAWAVVPMVLNPEVALDINLLIVAVVALVGFVLDCIIRPEHKNSSAEMDMCVDEYFVVSEEMARYNNTII